MSEGWQPVRIAPPPMEPGHIHHETIEMMAKNQGKIIRVRRATSGETSCNESFDVHPDDWHVFEGFEKSGRQTGTCICQILAD